MKFSLLLCFSVFFTAGFGQSIEEKIKAKNKDLAAIEIQKAKVQDDLENLKLLQIQQQLEEVGLPAVGAGEELVKHSAYILSFSPKYRQARWVAHIITPDIVQGVIFRTNDFRADSLVRSG